MSTIRIHQTTTSTPEQFIAGLTDFGPGRSKLFGNSADETARSQIIGGIAMGIGMALLEETVSDRTGRLVTTSLAEYVVAANADVRDVDVLFVGEPDSMTPLGTKGVGELAITGMAAAIANAVYHATGIRVRQLPISIEKVLGHDSSSAQTGAAREAITATASRARYETG